jgi:lipopolysaccharide export system ATP-binding protein
MSDRLVVDSLMHGFGLNEVLNGVYLSVQRGEVVGILGLNGTGKTTILRSITGELAADSMHLTIDGRVIQNAYRTGLVGHLTQEPFLLRQMRVASCVRWFLQDRGARKQILADKRVREYSDQRAGGLSGGEKRYVETLMILALPAPYLLMDEPFTEVEPKYREPLKEQIRNGAGDRGFILTDHAYRDILDVSDRVVVLANGELHDAPEEADLSRLGYTPRDGSDDQDAAEPAPDASG